MRPLLASAVLLLVAAPTLAAQRPCTQALVDAGICDRRADVLMYWSVPAERHDDLVAALSARLGYQIEVPCAADRQVDDHGVLLIAGAGDGDCTPGLDGRAVPNPQTETAAAHAYLRAELAQWAREHRIAERVEAARRAAEEEEPPVAP